MNYRINGTEITRFQFEKNAESCDEFEISLSNKFSVLKNLNERNKCRIVSEFIAKGNGIHFLETLTTVTEIEFEEEIFDNIQEIENTLPVVYEIVREKFKTISGTVADTIMFPPSNGSFEKVEIPEEPKKSSADNNILKFPIS